MSEPLHKYQIRVANGSNQQVSSMPLKFDLEQILTEASMVAEIFDREVIVYSQPTIGGQWQILQRVNPPDKEDKDE